jgi:hypothetical protein
VVSQPGLCLRRAGVVCCILLFHETWLRQLLFWELGWGRRRGDSATESRLARDQSRISEYWLDGIMPLPYFAVMLGRCLQLEESAHVSVVVRSFRVLLAQSQIKEKTSTLCRLRFWRKGATGFGAGAGEGIRSGSENGAVGSGSREQENALLWC